MTWTPFRHTTTPREIVVDSAGALRSVVVAGSLAALFVALSIPVWVFELGDPLVVLVPGFSLAALYFGALTLSRQSLTIDEDAIHVSHRGLPKPGPQPYSWSATHSDVGGVRYAATQRHSCVTLDIAKNRCCVFSLRLPPEQVAALARSCAEMLGVPVMEESLDPLLESLTGPPR